MTALPLLIASLSIAVADTITVDADEGAGADFTSIQDAVDAATSGDLINVNPGTYNETVTIQDKSITVAGSSSTDTTIWAETDQTGLTIQNGICGVSGLAIMNGKKGVSVRAASASLSDMLISDNAGADRGAGISVLDSSDVTLIKSTIHGNQAVQGGGAFVEDGSTLTINNGDGSAGAVSAFTDNEATEDGGAIYADGTVNIKDSTISENSAGGSGGGLYVTTISPQILNTELWDNTAGGNGGAIALIDTSTGGVSNRVKDSDIWGNEAAGDGGGIYLSGVSTYYVKGVVVFMNTAGGSGGGAYFSDVSNLNITFGRFWFNTAETDGGGLFASGLTGGESRKSSFGGNIATGDGGGSYYVDPVTGHKVHNNRYIENTASSGGGLMISGDSNRRHTIENIDAVGNDGDGITIVVSDLSKVVNAITVDNVGNGLSVDDSSTGGIFKNNDAYGNDTNWGGALSDLEGTEGNISDDPLYTRWTKDGEPIGDFLTLTGESPCIDAGKPDILDIVDGSISDMGSYGGADAVTGDEDGDGMTPADGDCDDGDSLVYLGAEEVAYDARDNDCAGGDDFDQDGDGFRHLQGDCDDSDADVNPDAEEIDGDGIDNDCDGLDGDEPIDEDADGDGDGDGDGDDTGGTSGTDTGAPWTDEPDTGDDDPYADADRDGYAQGEDCNDADATVYPGAEEICDDGVDNDCDGKTDGSDADCMPGESKGCGCAANTSSPIGWAWVLALVLGVRARRRQEV